MAKVKQQFNRRYDQYIADFDSNPDDNDELEGVFEALIMDNTDDTDHSDKRLEATTYFTLCGEVNPSQAYEIVNILANQITEYTLTQPTITEPTTYFTDRHSDT
jgi:hypothetical protein